MVALQIREVPADARDSLAGQARSRGQSLQSYLLALVEDEARRSVNLELLARFARRDDGSQLASAGATDALPPARQERGGVIDERL